MRNFIPAFVLTTSLLLVGAQANAVQNAAAQPDTNQSQAQQQTKADADKATTFSGKVMEFKGQYVLMETSTKSTFALDDQEKAKAFNGQTVKVTGTLEASSNTIHITSIEAS